MLNVVAWNVAAVNNNPFEYWITNDEDVRYNKIMKDVSNFIKNPGSKDIAVENVFTNLMFEQLKYDMNKVGWTGLDELQNRWDNDFSKRRIISQFLKDDVLGKKRLASMPDRITNTITTAKGEKVMRPTVINCYDYKIGDIERWWPYWLEFMFRTDLQIRKKNQDQQTKVYQMLQPILKAKYPAITDEEEKISIPLQTLCMAIFDSILIHMLRDISEGDAWEYVRAEMSLKLVKQKNQRTVDILASTYGNMDVQFLQEMSGLFANFAKNKRIAILYDIYAFEDMDSERDQNSFILLKKGVFKNVKDVTKDVVATLESQLGSGKSSPLAPGDLVALTAVHAKTEVEFLLASFHGDTNGNSSIPIVNAIESYIANHSRKLKLLFGIDANTHSKPEKDKLAVRQFEEFCKSKNISTCFGAKLDPSNLTTYNARTHLQPQLNKAVSFEERREKGDRNLKDYIAFFERDFHVQSVMKDNTGDKNFVEDMVFPTLSFPSDHGIISCTLEMK